MKRRILMAMLIAAAGGGCNGSGTNLADGGRAPDDPTARHTILLRIFREPTTHVQDAERFRRVLTERVGWRGLFTVNKAGHSLLFRGRYRTVEEAQGDLRAAKDYRTQNGLAIFTPMVVPLPGEDIGPPKWNLKGAGGTYTLLLAIFQDDPDHDYFRRRADAVDHCTRLRKAGYEAYYRHDPGASIVTIGAFGLKVYRIEPGPPRRAVVTDPKVKALQRDFPDLALNGQAVIDVIYDTKTKKKVRVKKRTYLIRIHSTKSSHGP